MEPAFEVCTAAKVREWIMRNEMESFCQPDIVRDTGLPGHPVSATLTKLHQMGALKVIGRKSVKVGNTTSRPYVYQLDDASLVEKFPVKRKPEYYTRGTPNNVKPSKHLEVPTIIDKKEPAYEISKEKVFVLVDNPIEYATKEAINELLSIGIELETKGVNRDVGLRLLRLTEHVFRNAK